MILGVIFSWPVFKSNFFQILPPKNIMKTIIQISVCVNKIIIQIINMIDPKHQIIISFADCDKTAAELLSKYVQKELFSYGYSILNGWAL